MFFAQLSYFFLSMNKTVDCRCGMSALGQLFSYADSSRQTQYIELRPNHKYPCILASKSTLGAKLACFSSVRREVQSSSLSTAL